MNTGETLVFQLRWNWYECVNPLGKINYESSPYQGLSKAQRGQEFPNIFSVFRTDPLRGGSVGGRRVYRIRGMGVSTPTSKIKVAFFMGKN